MTDLRHDLEAIVRRALIKSEDQPFELASGELSPHFIDGKEALASGEDLATAAHLVDEVLREHHVTFDAAGGLTMGADHLAHAIALVTGRHWFSVRKEPKQRGTNRLIEGARLVDGVRVLLVDDVVTTGGSIQRAYRAVRDTGAQIVAAVTLVDRGDVAAHFFERERVPYFPLFTYRQLEIDPVGDGHPDVAAARG